MKRPEGKPVMIRAAVTPGMLKRISNIEESRFRVANVKLPALAMNRLRKNSKKTNTPTKFRLLSLSKHRSSSN